MSHEHPIARAPRARVLAAAALAELPVFTAVPVPVLMAVGHRRARGGGERPAPHPIPTAHVERV